MKISEAIITFIPLTMTIILGILTMINFATARKKANTSEGAKSGEFESDIHFIKQLLLEVRDETREINKTLTQHSVDLAEVKESVKSAHKRIDEALERITELEHKGVK